jgi:hypothetical protein
MGSEKLWATGRKLQRVYIARSPTWSNPHEVGQVGHLGDFLSEAFQRQSIQLGSSSPCSRPTISSSHREGDELFSPELLMPL